MCWWGERSCRRIRRRGGGGHRLTPSRACSAPADPLSTAHFPLRRCSLPRSVRRRMASWWRGQRCLASRWRMARAAARAEKARPPKPGHRRRLRLARRLRRRCCVAGGAGRPATSRRTAPRSRLPGLRGWCRRSRLSEWGSQGRATGNGLLASWLFHPTPRLVCKHKPRRETAHWRRWRPAQAALGREPRAGAGGLWAAGDQAPARARAGRRW